MNLFERESPKTIRLPFHEFTDEAQERCKRCIHYYDTLKYNNKYYKGNFCCHWIDIKNLKYTLDDVKKGDTTLCHYRNRDSKHPFNQLRLNKKNPGVLNLDGETII